LLCCSLSQTAHAHALGIESSSTAAPKNGVQTVQAFHGGYEPGTKGLVKDCHAAPDALELCVQRPTGQATRWDTPAADDHLVASFTAEQDGLYLIHTTHAAGELGGQTKYIFSASLPIAVGESDLMITNPKEIDLLAFVSPRENHLNQPVDIYLLDKGNIPEPANVTVISAEGWAKTFKTDATGKVSFSPLWKGMYVVETSKYQPQEGVWNDKPHTHVWQSATTIFYVH